MEEGKVNVNPTYAEALIKRVAVAMETGENNCKIVEIEPLDSIEAEWIKVAVMFSALGFPTEVKRTHKEIIINTSW